MTPNPPRVDPDLVGALRADLAAARYTVAGVTELLGPMATAALDRDQALPAQRVTGASSAPGATLVRLFALGDPVDVAEAAAALPMLGVDGAVALGLVEPEGDAVVAQCDLRPHSADGVDWWVASDLGEVATRRPLRENHVLGIGGASTTSTGSPRANSRTRVAPGVPAAAVTRWAGRDWSRSRAAVARGPSSSVTPATV